jgi:cytosine/adenosine deaminase-related metal-dependent hydrolase
VDNIDGLAARLFECATKAGAQSLRFPGGALEAGLAADFFTIDLDDASIAGASVHDLLANVVFSLSRTAVKDVFVSGKQIIQDGRHRDDEQIVRKFAVLQKRLWS